MVKEEDAVGAAIAFAKTFSLNRCNARVVEQNKSGWCIVVEGMLDVHGVSDDDQDQAEMTRFLSEPFRLKVLIASDTCAVVRHEWVGIQFS